jgi:hypothetical protein
VTLISEYNGARSNRTIKVLMVGLDHSGKTTLLYRKMVCNSTARGRCEDEGMEEGREERFGFSSVV